MAPVTKHPMPTGARSSRDQYLTKYSGVVS